MPSNLTPETKTVQSNYSEAQENAIRDYAAKFGPLNADKVAKLAADPLFKTKSSRSIIGKVKNLGLPYETKAANKTPIAEGKPKDETAAQVEASIKALFGLADSVKLTQKTGLVALRAKAEAFMADHFAMVQEAIEDDSEVSESELETA